MNEFGSPESHVAQQSRRDKLRVQQGLSFGTSAGFPDLVHVRDVCGSGVFSPPVAVLDFSVAHSAAAGGGQAPSCSLALPSSGGILHEAVAGGGLSRSGHIQPQANCDWAAAGPSSLNPIHYLYQQQLRGYHDGSSDLHFAPPQFGYEGQELASVVGQQHGGRINTHPWVVDGAGNELPFLPTYNTAEYLPSTALMSRPSPHWNVDGVAATHKTDAAGHAAAREGAVHGAPTQGLSLSLSSNPVPELSVSQLEDRFMHGDAGPSCSYPKLSYGDRSGLLQGAVSAPGDARRAAGPLGPFTGYATILKNSKFLKPAQLLLDEFCNAVTGSRLGKQQCDVAEVGSGTSISVSKTVVGFEKEVENSMRGRNSAGASSSSIYSSPEAGCSNSILAGGAAKVCSRPEFQQKKAKLLYMQEEVCRRYKQYHQQMQMVVSSFESVAGLSSATPYASLGLKTVSKHFRSLKNAISDQLRHVSKLLGEEFMPSPSSSRGETMTTPKPKNLDQSLRKLKSGESNQGFTDHNQPVWRPQRGLPERAVSVLRAWLFEHFLHPYPTDTDKHMLATQTGLSRNQVSNWFINARVRLWKPMVEEIHMLETKGTNEVDLNSANRNETMPIMEVHDNPSGDHQMLEGQRSLPLNCTPMEHVFSEEGSQNLDSWQCEKRSRMDEHSGILTSMDGSLMSFSTYQHAMDIGGLGTVSLTLGLRHEGGQQHSSQIRHFENQMLHDFVG